MSKWNRISLSEADAIHNHCSIQALGGKIVVCIDLALNRAEPHQESVLIFQMWCITRVSGYTSSRAEGCEGGRMHAGEPVDVTLV